MDRIAPDYNLAEFYSPGQASISISIVNDLVIMRTDSKGQRVFEMDCPKHYLTVTMIKCLVHLNFWIITTEVLCSRKWIHCWDIRVFTIKAMNKTKQYAGDSGSVTSVMVML